MPPMRLLSSVSHDLKAPLANIEALVNDITESMNESNQEKRDTSVMLIDSIKKMRNVIDELSEVSKIEGHYQETIESVSFENILHEVEWTIKDKINESHAHINLDIKEREIEFSRKNLRSILYNLLSNAIKYKAPGRTPEILVKTEKDAGFVQITVKDNGMGIAEAEKDHIFDQFTRLEKGVEGTGIGLYLVKKIVENEGGKILVDSKVGSKVGEGSEFKVYLKPKA
jgi:two-component system, OmpR family, phosphate regulon sensor histidine kinase PhoR